MVEIGLVLDFPVAPHDDVAVADEQVVARQQLLDAPEERLAVQHELEGEVVLQALGVGLDRREERQQRLGLGGQEQQAVDLRVVEGLDAEAVARAEERLLLLVPEGEREHAAQLLQAVHAPAPVRAQDHLGVRRRAEGALAEHLAHLDVVVDLAVVSQPGAITVGHGLIAAREIDDRQPPVPERHAAALALPEAVAIGPAVCDQVVHGLHDGQQAAWRQAEIDRCCDAAHAA